MTASALPEIRPYRPNDEYGLVDLFRTVYGHDISTEHWRWKLRRAPAAANVWLAAAGERPVFQYGGIPTRFCLDGRLVNTMVAVDAMTAPEFRRRGLLTEVVTRAHTRWREQGVEFVLGLPNEKWGSRTRALGWQPLLPLRWLIRPLRPEAILARRLKLSFLKRIGMGARLRNRFLQKKLRRDTTVITAPIATADEAFDTLWKRCKSDWRFSTVRDREWVSWRFLASPERHYEVSLARRAEEPVGYCAHRVIDSPRRRIAQLGELFVAESDGAARGALLFDLVEKLLAADVESLFTLAVPGTVQYEWLQSAGFFAGPAFSVQWVPLSADIDVARMLEPRHWNLSGADFDVV